MGPFSLSSIKLFMPKQFVSFRFETLDAQQKDLLLGLLPGAGFDGIEEDADGVLIAFAEDGSYNADILNKIIEENGLNPSKSTFQEENWNAIWESSFEPVVIPGKVGVRASFHEPVKDVIHEIIITPKMSFGTGHHATTYLMMEAMFEHDLNGKSVFDFGTGTGILAILAEKLGAASVDAIDNDEWSIDNARENILNNSCSRIHLDLKNSMVSEKKYEYIFANINKGVILENRDHLYGSLVKGGVLILSGLLTTDEAAIVSSFESLLGQPLFINEKNNWISLTFRN
jgi:ribosomal protein L11 methyltransferase